MDARRGSLARRLIVWFLAVTVPGTLVLGTVTLYSIQSLKEVNRQLEEISLSLDATRDLNLALALAASPPRTYLLRGEPGCRQEFDRLIRAAQEKIASCASVACHGVSRTPKEMGGILIPAIERLQNEGRLIFETSRRGGVLDGLQWMDLQRMEEIDQLVSGASQLLQRMSAALLRRVEALRQQSRAVSRQASILTASLTLTLLMLGCAMAAVLAKRIARPLQELLLGTQRVMAGDCKYRVGVRDSGEIAELAASFNAMVEELWHHRLRLKDYNRTLQEQVRERTEELKQKEEVLRQTEKLASLGLLASGVAHELNNPLTSILMNANLMMEEIGEDSPLFQDLKTIDLDATRCKRIIDDLRAFSRHRELQKAPCRVEKVVEQVLRIIGHELDLRGIQLAWETATDLPELILGESGTGKEVLARFLHAESPRKSRPFVTVNCAAIPPNLLESELFGHIRGAFTGAVSSRRGSFELSDGGTLFLDEIGEMPVEMQAKILRALEERQIKRVGSEESIAVNVRIIAATNRDLEQWVKVGRFREDLYWRLNVVLLVVPPLRERPEDVLPLARYFLARYGQELKKAVPDFSHEVLETFARYDWPGNVRELRNAVERAVIFAEAGRPIRLAHLPPHIRHESSREAASASKSFHTLREMELQYIRDVLESCGGNRTRAAEVLGISPVTLWRKLGKEGVGEEAD